MTKRDYTHVQALQPEIKVMVESGKSQREIAEHYGFKDKLHNARKRDDFE